MWQDVVNLLRRVGLLRPMEEMAVRLTGYSIMGRMITWNAGVPYVDSLMLRSVGAKSGDLRDAVLFYVPDGQSWVIIGSVGGGPKHPAWVHNLRANPHAWVFVDRSRHPVEAEFLEGDERERLWSAAAEVWPPYLQYAERAQPRVIEIIRLNRST
ncbi:MAG: nitroreductase/quinone reductase family protein [Chloroflexota bacterium]|nr:nitroreductase/quinone reductase family protein [Chloroflexota bacterium]MDE2895153.1 nitroreductase/quinone reductase family protein [Chloroflexota bacterium]